MHRVTDYPAAVLLVSLGLLWSAAILGARVLRRDRQLSEETDKHYALVLGATLTLLSLIVGFSFSMAVGRYDQRKNLEEEEANAIGTEYLRADLLPGAAATRVRGLLKSYLEQRIVFYSSHDRETLRRSDLRTAELQRELWAAVAEIAAERQTPTIALAVVGMNDVLNSQGYALAAWRNRIPVASWLLMASMAVCSCLLVGYGVHSVRTERLLMLVVPLVVSLALFLIAEIDSPRTGLIRVLPLNLMSAVELVGAP